MPASQLPISSILGGLLESISVFHMSIQSKAYDRQSVAKKLLAGDHITHEDAHPHQQRVLDAANHLKSQAAGDLDGKGRAQIDEEAHEDGCQVVQRLVRHEGQTSGQEALPLPDG